MFIHLLFDLQRQQKQQLLLLFDMAVVLWSFLLAMLLSADPSMIALDTSLLLIVGSLLFSSFVIFTVSGFYKTMIRYMGRVQLLKIVLASVLSTMVLAIVMPLSNYSLQLGGLAVYITILSLFLVSSRLLVADVYERISSKKLDKVLIYGAGDSGVQLPMALKQSNKYQPVGLIDDQKSLQGMNLHGLRVYPPRLMEKLIKEEDVKQIMLALPSLARKRRKEIIDLLTPLPVRVRTVPGLADLVNGDAKIDQVKDIDVEDLLGRDQVEPIKPMMEACIKDKVVLITGAGGSIGSELARQIAQLDVGHLILFDSSEYCLYQVERDVQRILESQSHRVRVTTLLGSVLEKKRLTSVFKTFHVNTVYHAAAYKHVPMVEHNVISGVRNNVFGTWYCAEAAIAASVETFVLVSTDKAVRSTNVMGATKRLSELILQGLAQNVDVPNYCMVRFGNVLGSSGSVVPLFREQIKEGGPVTVTHPEIIRYFMTIPEAAQLVIQAGALAKHGEVFVLDMGEPVKIADLARKLIRLMGLEVKSEEHEYGDIEIEFTGLRPGEKLYEELLIGDNPSGTDHPRIMCAEELTLPWEKVKVLLSDLERACDQDDCEKVRELLLNSESGYSPNEEMSDLIWREKSKQKAKSNNVVEVFGGPSKGVVTP